MATLRWPLLCHALAGATGLALRRAPLGASAPTTRRCAPPLAMPAPTSRVYFDVSIGGADAGRVEFDLWGEVAPRTAENFRSLITGERGRHPTDKSVLLHYKGSKIHRVVKDSHCQGGDLMNGDGTWSKSAFAPPAEEFEDENFILRHTGPGVLSMCNRGPNTNGSAFFLSFVELPWMNENHVVFGCVANTESLSVLYEIEHAGTECGRPSGEVLILDCGQLYPL